LPEDRPELTVDVPIVDILDTAGIVIGQVFTGETVGSYPSEKITELPLFPVWIA
jgi:hypothetical protein